MWGFFTFVRVVEFLAILIALIGFSRACGSGLRSVAPAPLRFFLPSGLALASVAKSIHSHGSKARLRRP